MLRLILIFVLLALPAHSEEVVAGLSQNRVSITANFDGSEILIFGAVKREAPVPEGRLDVIITVEGPEQTVTVRRKERILGLWINKDAVDIVAAPSFYAVASSGDLAETVSLVADLENAISVHNAVGVVNLPPDVRDSASFSQALIRIRGEADLYQQLENAVEVTDDTLFQTRIALPSNLVEGDYATRIFLARGGEIIADYETGIDVRKVGLERFLFNLSRQRPLIYGLLSLAIAIAAGWGASAVFRLIRT